MSLSLQINQAFDRNNAQQGQKYNLSTSYATQSGFGLNASLSKYSEKYREFSQAIDKSFSGTNKMEYSLGASWGHPVIGTMSASFYDVTGFDSQNNSRYATLNWERVFAHFLYRQAGSASSAAEVLSKAMIIFLPEPEYSLPAAFGQRLRAQ